MGEDNGSYTRITDPIKVTVSFLNCKATTEMEKENKTKINTLNICTFGGFEQYRFLINSI